MPMGSTISAVIISCNEADVIEPCLQSVAGWVNEIVVVDMWSTDGTRDIVHRYTDRLIDHERLTYADPVRNFALEQATGDWIIMLDPDERVPEPLARELSHLATCNVDVVTIPFRQIMFGRMVQSPGASDIAHPRFFRRGAITWPSEVHTLPDTSHARCYTMPSGTVDLSIHHDTWRSIQFVLDKIGRYAPKDVENLRAQGQRFTLGGMLYNACGQFVHRMVVGRAYEDGMAGFLTALYFAFYHLTIHAELWEAEGRPGNSDRAIERWGWWLSIPYRVGRHAACAGRSLAVVPGLMLLARLCARIRR